MTIYATDNFPQLTPHALGRGAIVQARRVRKAAEGLDDPCHLTAKREQLAHCRRWNLDAWLSQVEGLSLVKHKFQESSPGQQVIKKYLQLWNLPMDGTMHKSPVTAQCSQNRNEEWGRGNCCPSTNRQSLAPLLCSCLPKALA